MSNNWDMTDLSNNEVSTPHNSSVLPSGMHTVTFQGAVYGDAVVDYFIYGIWARISGKSESYGEHLVTGWRYMHFLAPGGTDIPGRLAWFRAGYYGSFSFLSGTSIPNVLPANPPPVGEDFGGLTWFFSSTGFMLGTN
jgi:hypothetical protein